MDRLPRVLKAVGVVCVVALLVWVWARMPKSVWYKTVEIPVPEGFVKIEDLHINDNGLIAGTLKGGIDQNDHLFLWDREKGLTDLGSPDFLSGHIMANVTDINNRGQLTGFFTLKTDDPNYLSRLPSHPGSFFYDPKTGFRDIGSVKGFQYFHAVALNEREQVVGYSARLNLAGRREEWIFLWSPETGFHVLNLIGHPMDLNNASQILGYNELGKSYFLWSSGVKTEMPKPSSQKSVYMFCLRDSGQAIGGIEYDWDIDSEVNQESFQIVLWDPNRGYLPPIRISSQKSENTAMLAMNDRKVLFSEEIEAFDWFGLVDQPESTYRILVYTVGEKVAILKGIPNTGNPVGGKSWEINRDGWIVGVIDTKAYVMIPKGKAGKKKD